MEHKFELNRVPPRGQIRERALPDSCGPPAPARWNGVIIDKYRNSPKWIEINRFISTFHDSHRFDPTHIDLRFSTWRF